MSFIRTGFREIGLKIRCYYLETSDLPLHISECLRTKTAITDAHNVNMSSTVSATELAFARAGVEGSDERVGWGF